MKLTPKPIAHPSLPETMFIRAYSYMRFSTPEQEKGDSLRRQVEQSEKYCQDHGIVLDDSLRLTDRGLSAFRGANRTKGALGEFHRLLEAGEVEPGSILLVESLDRLSREQVLDALAQFMGLINAGVRVVTLADGMEYDLSSITDNFGQLIVSLVIMSRAHEESVTKSLRGRATWEQKRKQGLNNGHKLTKRCPAWLKLSEDRNSFIVLDGVANVVYWIFKMKLECMGSEAIARRLNAEKNIWVPPARGKKKKFSGGWRKSYVNKILRNRAVIGEFQPYSKASGKRLPEGEPVIDYFPAIVEPDLFNQVQAFIQENRGISGNAGGRTGAVNNLFGHIGRCFYCGAPMAYVNKGQRPKGGSYLVCDNARRGLGCKKTYIRYDQIEPLILAYCKGLDPGEILPGNEEIQGELSMLKGQLYAVEGELIQVQRRITNLIDSLEETDNPEAVKPIKDRIGTLQEQKAGLEAQQQFLSRQINKTASTIQDAEKQLQDIKELIDYMVNLDEKKRIELRLNLRNHLRRLLDQINFLPDVRQVGLLFKTGGGRLLEVEGDQVYLLDVLPGAKKVPGQLWDKHWEMHY